MRLAHVDNPGRPIAEDAQRNNPIQDLVIPGLLDIFGAERCQVVPFAALYPGQMAAVKFDIDGAALEFVG